MSSTIYLRKTPMASGWRFKIPLKTILTERFGCGDRVLALNSIPYLEGVLAAGALEPEDRRQLIEIIEALNNGHTIDVWLEG